METSKTGWFSAGAVLSGIAAASCCLGPALLAFGVGGLGFLTRLEPYRPIFMVSAVGFLGYAFYKTYRRPANAADCCPPERLRVQKIVLWAATVLTLTGIFFPYLLFVFR
jgi:mercuric ion transport protein